MPDHAAPRAAVVSRAVHRAEGDALCGGEDLLVEELPVALVFDGRPHAVMLATPNDLEDFALGFALSEGLVERAEAIEALTVRERPAGIEIAMRLAAGSAIGARTTRAFAGRSGCGLCGVESLAHFEAPCPPVAARPVVSGAAIARAFAAMRASQRLHALTGGAHAALWADMSGVVQVLREDVGRHNALDKLLGALARGGFDPRQGFVAISSRASYEIVHKSARLGIGVVAALAAPTAHAARSAEALGMTLIARARGARFTVVTGADAVRLTPEPVHAT
jgi:formate dehydrogenase accessory protein FdhD